MSKITIRPARPSEHKALEALLRRSSLQWEDYRAELLAHPDAMRLPPEQIAAGMVIVADRDGELAGFAVVLPRDDGNVELDGLFVDPDMWGGGVGRRLVDEAARFAQKLEAALLFVTANPRAAPFYARLRFDRCGETATRFGPAPVMARSLVF